MKRLGSSGSILANAILKQTMTGSVIAYPVEVPLSLTPDLRTPQVRAVAGEIRCWAPE